MSAYQLWRLPDVAWTGLHDWDFIPDPQKTMTEPAPQWHTPLYGTEGFTQPPAQPPQPTPPITERHLQALRAAYLRWPYTTGANDDFPLADVPAALKELHHLLTTTS